MSNTQTDKNDLFFLTQIGKDDKDAQKAVKELGAVWNKDVKRWQVPAGVDREAFKDWRCTREELKVLREAGVLPPAQKKTQTEPEVKEPEETKKEAAKRTFHKKGDVFLSPKILAKDKEAHEKLKAAGARWDPNALSGHGCWYMPEDKLDNLPQVKEFWSEKVKKEVTEDMSIEDLIAARCGKEKAAEIEAAAARRQEERDAQAKTQEKTQTRGRSR